MEESITMAVNGGPLVNRRYQVGQGHVLGVLAALEDAGCCFLRPLVVAGKGEQSCDGLAVARDGQALGRGLRGRAAGAGCF